MDVDSTWAALRREAHELARGEPLLAPVLLHHVLNREGLADAVAWMIGGKLASLEMPAAGLRELCAEVLGGKVRAGGGLGDRVQDGDRGQAGDAGLAAAACRDLWAAVDRDPAAHGALNPFINHKGFHALQAYRIGHALWNAGRRFLALHLQGRSSLAFGVDIHPAARLGSGIFIDHGTGVVIGETAVVGDEVSMLQGVTLGGTGKDGGDRHPKVGRGVLLSAGSTVLGNIRIGDGAKVGAGSVVLQDVPPHTTVVGVPGRAVGPVRGDDPGLTMDHVI